MLDDLLAAIDDANAADPALVHHDGADVARSLLQGRRATHWLHRLADEPPPAVQLAVRAHHLRRFERPRGDYPDGRAGYLRWRRDARTAHAAALADLLARCGAEPALVDRAAALVRREGLGTDPEAQLVEDAACLVFCETDLDALLARLGPERTADALVKTAKKMSATALALVQHATPPGPARALLTEVLG
ncbi:MAG: DUF4202 domain-containing protein [Acidimicrobiia bacterium]|nr:DUF4202 domain-containing protein [Acidimicrobiia bacterium]